MPHTLVAIMHQTMQRLFRVLLCTALSLSAQAETVRFGMDLNYPPFSWLDADGVPQGFDTEIAYGLCQKMKVHCQIVPQDWDGLTKALNMNKFDAILSSMQITPERMNSLDFSHKYYHVASRMVTRIGNQVSEQAFAQKRIGVLRGSTQEKYARDYWGKNGAEIVAYDKISSAFDALTSQHLDAVFVDNIVGNSAFLQTSKGKGFAFVGPSYDNVRYFGSGAGIAVKKGNVQLLNRLNQAIDQLRNDGSYQKIAKKYFSFDIYGN
jgi:arginine/ornithine transport system substrate-binding protein